MKKTLASVIALAAIFNQYVSAQNVGIGTSNPAAKLEIKGHSGTDLFNLKDHSNTSRLYVKEAGNVGIGTADPNTKLQVVGDVMVGLGTNGYYSTPTGQGAITLNGSTPGGLFRLVANDGSGTFNQYQNAYYDGTNWKYNYGTEATRFTSSSGTFGMYVAPSGTTGGNITWKPGIYIDNNANVGIGKTNPGSALDVKGTVRISGSNSGYVGLSVPADAGSTTYTLPSSDGSAGQVLATNGSGGLSWATASAGTGGIKGMQVLTSGTTYTPTAGTTKVMLVMVGGGGAGGGAAASTANSRASVGSGGGSGGYLTGYITLGTGTYTISVGAGGAGSAGASGGDGGNTTFKNGTTGETYTAFGGKGGSRTESSQDREDVVGGNGGAVSTVSGGGFPCVLVGGTPGGYGWQRQSSEQSYSGFGGSSYFGGGGKAVTHNDTDYTSGAVSLAGNAATGYGSGGSGATTKRETNNNAAAAAGGAGAAGVIIVYEY